MKFKPKHYLLFLLIFLAPILVNYIVSTNRCFDYNIAGGPKDWISFYGSFSGGVITALISLMIVNLSLNHSSSELKRSRAIQDLKDLKIDLARIVSLSNFTDIASTPMKETNYSRHEAEIQKLKQLHSSIIYRLNSTNLVYMHTVEAEKFLNANQICSEQMLQTIAKMIRFKEMLIDGYIDKGNKGIMELNIKLGPLNKEHSRSVYNEARKWIQLCQTRIDEI